MTFTTPDLCGYNTGHRFPADNRLKPGQPRKCIWCGFLGSPKSDPRVMFGARTVDAAYRFVI